MPIINAMMSGRDYESLIPAVSRYPAKLGITVQNTTIEGTNIQGVEIIEFAGSQYDISKKMREGDVIVGINSYSVSTKEQIGVVLDSLSPGDVIRISFYRSGQKMTVDVILGK